VLSRGVGSGQIAKTVDLAVTPTVVDIISATGTFTLLNGTQEGAGFYNRVGRRITMNWVQIIGQINLSANVTTGVNEYFRIMVVYDRQANGALPVIGDILQDFDQSGANGTSSFSGMNMNNADRFLMLRDVRYAIPNNGNTALNAQTECIVDGNGMYNINMYVPIGLQTHYKAAAPATIASIATGALYLVTFGNVAAGANGYRSTFNSRLRFSDS